jgi:hypothetical protein
MFVNYAILDSKLIEYHYPRFDLSILNCMIKEALEACCFLFVPMVVVSNIHNQALKDALALYHGCIRVMTVYPVALLLHVPLYTVPNQEVHLLPDCHFAQS